MGLIWENKDSIKDYSDKNNQPLINALTLAQRALEKSIKPAL